MALQEHLTSMMGTDVPSAHTSLPPAMAAMNFAASFHRDAQACRGAREREQLHKIYRDKILAIDTLAANVAAAFLPVFGPIAGRNDADAERWGDFDRLAQRGKNMRDRESQRLQHQSGIIAAWGFECFQYYGWHALPLPLLRQLHDLAVLIPRWDDVVDLLNSKMLARHELRVLRGRNKALRIGEHSAASKVQDTRSPVERADILAALDWARQKATSAVARQQVKKSARGINGTPIKNFGLKRDPYGMVVPSIALNDSDDNDDGDDDVSVRDLSTRPAKRTKLSATEPGRLIFPDLVGNPKARQRHAPDSENAPSAPVRSNDSSDQDCHHRNHELSGSKEPEPEPEAESYHMEHVQDELPDDDQALETTAMEGIRVEEEETSDRGLEDVHAEVEMTQNSTMSSEFREAKEDTESTGTGSIAKGCNNRADRSRDGRSDEEEAEEVELKENEETRDVRKDIDADWGMISRRSQSLGVMEEALDEIVLDTQRNSTGEEEADLEGIAGAEAEVGIQDDGAEEEEEVVDQAGNVEGEDHEGVEDAGAAADSQEGVLDAGRTGTSVNRTAGSDSAHARDQRGSSSASYGLAARSAVPLLGRVVNSPYQAGKLMSSGQHRLSATVLGGEDNNKPATAAEETRRLNTPAPTQPRSSDVDNSDSPSRRPATLLQSLQARHAAKIHQLVKDLSRPHVSLDVAHQRRLQLDWLHPQRWASIYVEPEHHLGRSSVASSDDADVWYLSWDTFRRYADSGHIFQRPVVIKQIFQDSGMYDIAEYIDMLWQRFPEQQIDVQNSMTGACVSMSMKEYCMTVTTVDLSSSDDTASVSNAINLRRLARADEPLLSRLSRFRLLSTLMDRATSTVGRSEYFAPNQIEDCLGFDVLGFTGAFSRSHVDPLIGSWVRCLAGVKIWAIATDLDTEDWRRFSNEGCNWSPQGKGRLVVLEQDDVLFMPPGLRVVHASFTPEPCLMEGGLLWDECAIPEILEGLLWIARHQACTTEPLAFQLSTLIDALEQWLDGDNHVYQSSHLATAAEHRQAVKASIQSLRACLEPNVPPHRDEEMFV